MYYVYVLYSKTLDKTYTGSTGDLQKRLSQHNAGESTWTKRGIPWELIYYEASHNELDARNREKYLRTGFGKRYVSSRLKHFLT